MYSLFYQLITYYSVSAEMNNSDIHNRKPSLFIDQLKTWREFRKTIIICAILFSDVSDRNNTLRLIFPDLQCTLHQTFYPITVTCPAEDSIIDMSV